MIAGIALVFLAYLILRGVDVYLNFGTRQPTWGEKNDPVGKPREPSGKG
jgi:hypothetical protein